MNYTSHKTKPLVYAAALIYLTLSISLGLVQTLNARDRETRLGEQRPINSHLMILFVVGDSTANNNANGAQGWGDPFISYFDAKKINVLNRARGGRSSRTFITEGLWDKVLSEMKRGDFVLIQFGHNDAGATNDASRARGSLPGTGEETQEIDNVLTKKHEVVHTYGWYMRKMIADTKAKGAMPIVMSLTVRNIWKNNRVERGSGKFVLWAAEIVTVRFAGQSKRVTAAADGRWLVRLDPMRANATTATMIIAGKNTIEL